MMTNRHIAILSPINRHPGKPHGGITPVVTKLAKHLTGRGICTDLIVFVSANSSLRPSGVASEIHVFNLGSAPKAINAYRLWQYLSATSHYRSFGVPTRLLPGVSGFRLSLLAYGGSIQNMISAGQQESHIRKNSMQRLRQSHISFFNTTFLNFSSARLNN